MKLIFNLDSALSPREELPTVPTHFRDGRRGCTPRLPRKILSRVRVRAEAATKAGYTAGFVECVKFVCLTAFFVTHSLVFIKKTPCVLGVKTSRSLEV